MRPTDLERRLNRLAELAGTDQRLRRVLENVDFIADAALNAEATYVNKKGDAITVEAPQWAVALNAQKLGAQLLGLDATPESASASAGQPSAVDRIEANARARLAAVPKPSSG